MAQLSLSECTCSLNVTTRPKFSSTFAAAIPLLSNLPEKNRIIHDDVFTFIISELCDMIKQLLSLKRLHGNKIKLPTEII